MAEPRILIIDDSTELRSLLESVLPYGGYHATSATTGQDGLSLAEESKPDLILLDLELPDTTGLQVLEELARLNHPIPTIMMTGYGSEGVAADALRLGAVGYLVKPFTTEEVLSSIERALSVGRLHREKAQLTTLLEANARHLQMIHAIGRALIAGHELDQFFQRIAEAGLYATRADACFLSLLDPAREQLHTVAACGKTSHIGHRFPLQAGDVRLRNVLSEGTRLRLRASPGSSIILQTGRAVKAVLQVPLINPEEIVGVLSVDRRNAGTAFGRQDEQVLAILADYVIIARDKYPSSEAAHAEPAPSPAPQDQPVD